MNRARAKRLYQAWDRYNRRYPDMRVSLGNSMGHDWYLRGIRARRRRR